MQLQCSHQSPGLAQIARGQPPSLQLVRARPGAHRQALESFIRRRFAEQHHAHVRHFMPCLLGLETADGKLHGAVGWRSAKDQPLFLEHYLDLPVEQAIRQYCGRVVPRSDVVEVGNLAAESAGAARLLIVSLAELLAAQGFRWVAFTGTQTLLNSFRRLGLAPHGLGLADPVRIGAEAADWGSYYANRPQVMVGEIQLGRQQLM